MGGLFGMFSSGNEAKRGCELAPSEPPPGLKLATFAGVDIFTHSIQSH